MPASVIKNSFVLSTALLLLLHFVVPGFCSSSSSSSSFSTAADVHALAETMLACASSVTEIDEMSLLREARRDLFTNQQQQQQQHEGEEEALHETFAGYEYLLQHGIGPTDLSCNNPFLGFALLSQCNYNFEPRNIMTRNRQVTKLLAIEELCHESDAVKSKRVLQCGGLLGGIQSLVLHASDVDLRGLGGVKFTSSKWGLRLHWLYCSLTASCGVESFRLLCDTHFEPMARRMRMCLLHEPSPQAREQMLHGMTLKNKRQSKNETADIRVLEHNCRRKWGNVMDILQMHLKGPFTHSPSSNTGGHDGSDDATKRSEPHHHGWGRSEGAKGGFRSTLAEMRRLVAKSIHEWYANGEVSVVVPAVESDHEEAKMKTTTTTKKKKKAGGDKFAGVSRDALEPIHNSLESTYIEQQLQQGVELEDDDPTTTSSSSKKIPFSNFDKGLQILNFLDEYERLTTAPQQQAVVSATTKSKHSSPSRSAQKKRRREEQQEDRLALPRNVSQLVGRLQQRTSSAAALPEQQE